MVRRLVGWTAFLVVVGLLWATATGAQSPEEVDAIAKKLNCPLCQGLTLSDCPLPVCEQWRDIIKDKLAQGETEEEIIGYFVEQYGEQVLNAPPKRGFTLWFGWVLPLVALGAGAAFVAYVMRGWLKRRGGMGGAVPPAESAAELPQEYLERLKRELEEFG